MEHFGYEKSECIDFTEEVRNKQNGSKTKPVNSSFGRMDITVI